MVRVRVRVRVRVKIGDRDRVRDRVRVWVGCLPHGGPRAAVRTVVPCTHDLALAVVVLGTRDVYDVVAVDVVGRVAGVPLDRPRGGGRCAHGAQLRPG